MGRFSLKQNQNTMTHWQPDFTDEFLAIRALPSDVTIYPERVQDWLCFLDSHSELPPVLICANGWVVNGHHRLEAAKIAGVLAWSIIVEFIDGHWVANGNVARVSF